MRVMDSYSIEQDNREDTVVVEGNTLVQHLVRLTVCRDFVIIVEKDTVGWSSTEFKLGIGPGK